MRAGALLVIFAGTAAIACVYAAAIMGGAAPAWGGAVFAVATAMVLVGFMVLGASRAGSIGWLWAAFGFAFAVLAGGFVLALVLPADQPGDALILGLPRRAAIIMYGIGLLPAFIIPVAYALSFPRLTLSEDDLRRVRAVRAAAESAPSQPVHAGSAAGGTRP